MTVRMWARWAALAVAAWVGLAFAGGVAANPFGVAVEAACEAGGWSPDEVRFESGTYRFLLVVTVAEADLVLRRGGEEVTVDVQVLHAPFLGWELRRLAVAGEALPGLSR